MRLLSYNPLILERCSSVKDFFENIFDANPLPHTVQGLTNTAFFSKDDTKNAII